MCATSNSAFDGSATALLRSRATSALRPGATSRISGVIPSFVKMPAMYFAAACSFPGGFVVLIFTNSTSQSCASRANALVFPTNRLLGGIPMAGRLCNLRTQESRFRKEQQRNKHSRRTALPTQKAPPGRINFATGKKTY